MEYFIFLGYRIKFLNKQKIMGYCIKKKKKIQKKFLLFKKYIFNSPDIFDNKYNPIMKK